MRKEKQVLTLSPTDQGKKADVIQVVTIWKMSKWYKQEIHGRHSHDQVLRKGNLTGLWRTADSNGEGPGLGTRTRQNEENVRKGNSPMLLVQMGTGTTVLRSHWTYLVKRNTHAPPSSASLLLICRYYLEKHVVHT